MDIVEPLEVVEVVELVTVGVVQFVYFHKGTGKSVLSDGTYESFYLYAYRR